MNEVADDSIQLAITSLPDIHITPPKEMVKRMYDDSRFLLVNRMFFIRDFYPFLRPMVNELYRILKPDGVFILNIGAPVRFMMASGYSVILPFLFAEYIMYESPLQLRRDFIANQNPSENILVILPEEQEHGLACTHEHLLMFTKGDKWKMKAPPGSVVPSSWFFSRGKDPVVEKFREQGVMLPTPFPREVIKFILEIFTDEGDTVLDPCGGSGTLGAVATQTNRNAILYEIDPAYVPVIKENVENGEKPVKCEIYSV